MVEIFKYVDKFFTSLTTTYLTFNYIFIVFVGLFLLTMLGVIFSTSRAYEARLIKAIDKFNVYFIDNPQINEENLVAFNAKMKSNKVPKQLRKHWQQFVLYREDKASAYMSFENCVANPIKNSTYTRDVKIMGVLAYVFAIVSLILNTYYCSLFESADVAYVLKNILLTPVIILLLNYLAHIFLNLRHTAIVSDLFQNYQYFEVNIDKATETLPEYVDYEVLFDRNEIKKGIPILYTYLQKRAEEEQRELERARLKNIEHEKFNFDDQGVAASLVLERAMQEAENYIAERKKYNQDIGQINSDITQEDMNYREITKEYNRQMQVSKETFANFKSQLEEVSSTIEANYLKKQQQQELDRQRNLERDFDTATERHKKVIESYHKELDSVDKFIAQSRKNLEDAMKSEFSSYSSKVYDEAKKLVDEREKDKQDGLKKDIMNLEEQLVARNKEIDLLYQQNQVMSDKLQEIGIVIGDQPYKDEAKPVAKKSDEDQPKEIKPEYKSEPEESFENTPEQAQYDDEYVADGPEVDYGYQDNQYQDDYTEADNYQEEVPSSEENYEEENYVDDEQYYEEPEVQEEFAEDYSDETFDEAPEETFDEYPEETFEENSDDELEEKYYIDEEEEEVVHPQKPQQVGNIKVIDDFDDEEFETKKPVVAKNSTVPTGDSIKQEKVVSKRGRPRKVVDTTKQGEKRKPGRPRKEVSQVKETESKRKVGRPRKVETTAVAPVEEKRGRGRPRKVEATKVQVAEEKRGRGRPRKETPTAEPKRKVGRPRKEEVAQKPTKKGPGRPRKQVDNISTDIRDIDAYIREIDNAIAAENAKLEETQKALAKKAKIKGKK